MNVYNLHYLWGLLGSPVQCTYHPTRGREGIDTAGLAVLQYPEFAAACLAAKDSDGECGCVIQGTEGRLVLHGGTNALEEVYSITRSHRNGGVRTDPPPAARHRMAYEFAAFARILAEQDRQAEAQARRRTLAVMEMIDALRANTCG